MKRFIVEIPLGDLRAIGTAHMPAVTTRREAVVLLNAGHVPRNGHGGLAAQLADRLCAHGRPALRVDLPGLGDARGPLPERIETFWLELKDGGHSSWAAGISRFAAEAFSAERVTLGGVCGAAVTAIFTADRHPDAAQSLLLIEPELFSSEPPSTGGSTSPDASGPRVGMEPGIVDPAAIEAHHLAPGTEDVSSRRRAPDVRSAPARSRCSYLTRLTSSWRWMRLLSRRRASLPGLSHLQQILLRLGGATATVPDRSNLALVQAWSRVAGRNVPALVMTARGLLWEAYFTRLREGMLAGGSEVRHVSVPGANHVFSNEAARSAVLERVPGWLDEI